MKRPEDFMVIPVITIWKLMRTKYFCTIIIFQFCLLNQLASDNNNNNNDKIIIIKKDKFWFTKVELMFIKNITGNYFVVSDH